MPIPLSARFRCVFAYFQAGARTGPWEARSAAFILARASTQACFVDFLISALILWEAESSWLHRFLASAHSSIGIRLLRQSSESCLARSSCSLIGVDYKFTGNLYIEWGTRKGIGTALSEVTPRFFSGFRRPWHLEIQESAAIRQYGRARPPEPYSPGSSHGCGRPNPPGAARLSSGGECPSCDGG